MHIYVLNQIVVCGWAETERLVSEQDTTVKKTLHYDLRTKPRYHLQV